MLDWTRQLLITPEASGLEGSERSLRLPDVNRSGPGCPADHPAPVAGAMVQRLRLAGHQLLRVLQVELLCTQLMKNCW